MAQGNSQDIAVRLTMEDLMSGQLANIRQSVSEIGTVASEVSESLEVVDNTTRGWMLSSSEQETIMRSIHGVTNDVVEAVQTLDDVAGGVVETIEQLEEPITDFEVTISRTGERMNQFGEIVRAVNDSVEETVEFTLDLDEALVGAARRAQDLDRVAEPISGRFLEIGVNAADALEDIGLLPMELKRAAIGVYELRNAMMTSTTVAAGLSASIGPLVLIAGGIIYAVQAFRDMNREVEIVTKSLDEMLGEVDDIEQSSDDLGKRIQENNELIKKLNSLGGDKSFISRLDEENDRLETQQIALQNIYEFRMVQARQEAAENIRQLERSRDEVAAHLQSLRAEFAASTERGLFDRTIYSDEELLGMFGFSEDSIERTKGMLLSVWDSVQEGFDGITYDEKMLGFVTTHIQELMEQAEILRGSTIPAHIETVAAVDLLTAGYNELIGDLGLTGDAVKSLQGDVEDHIDALERQANRVSWNTLMTEKYQKALDEQSKGIVELNNNILSATGAGNGLDSVIVNMVNAHNSLTNALNGTNSEQESQLDAFNAVMNLGPEYLQFLLDEDGNLRSVEDAVEDVTSAQIELLGVRQANAVLDSMSAWQEETGSLVGYRGAVIDATNGVWGLVEARMALIRATETEKAMEVGTWDAILGSTRALESMENQINAIRGMTTSAQGARSERVGGIGNLRDFATQAGAGKALKVQQQGAIDITQESIQAWHRVNTENIRKGLAAQNAPNLRLNLNLSGTTNDISQAIESAFNDVLQVVYSDPVLVGAGDIAGRS